MNNKLIHVYLMPGLAANPTIFEHIKLDENQFKIHWLKWMMPEVNETLESYAKRMVAKIEYDDVVLLGVSFGGILVQEMSKHIKLRALFVVSSVKSMHELPKRMKVMKYTKAYKILPTQLVRSIDLLAKYSFGDNITKRIELYKKYLSVRDPQYLDWAIAQVIEWDQDAPNKDAIYIQGDNDAVFPHSCVGNCIIIKGGTHIMIINKYKWFNENLPKLILPESVD
ncbi:alpha/beta hydrolase [Sediminibacter sp. Hel_I_10]|uniref:alpha/beta hydrolase n=1 Tax=Sediminibacter sp. Hel_I_10 TaxID=1392490 RepID=UPI00047B819C|nr:alpha/beta hydrolase [Sediminibacter sp. Hel_I_10]